MTNLQLRQSRPTFAAPTVRDADGLPSVFCGTAIVYDSPSELIFGHFREYIRPGAVRESLTEYPDVLCFAQHNAAQVLGRVSARTLRLTDGDAGLQVECDMPNTTYAVDLRESMRRGDVRGMSFGFDVVSDRWYREDGVTCREVTKLRLYEVSFVTVPAYPATDASVRALLPAVDDYSNLHRLRWLLRK